MIRVFMCVAAIFIATNIQAQQEKYIDKIIAKVGDEYLLLSELEAQHSLLKSEQGFLPEDARCMLLGSMLTQNLLLNQAKLDSVVVSDEEVESQLNARIDRILSLMNNDIQQFQDYYGRSVNEVKTTMREDLRDKLLMERMQNELMQTTRITPAEVTAFFGRIPKDSLPYFSSEVELGEIIMYPEVNEEQDSIARTSCEFLRNRVIEEGEDFGELAKKYSQDPGSGRLGGDLGWAKRGTYVPEFEANAYSLEPGEYSEVFRTDFGYHFLQLLERRGNRIHVRHILIKPRITEADLQLTYQKLDSIRQQLLADSISFSLAVKRFSDEDEQSYNNDGRMINPKTGNTFFETADLDPNVYFTIEGLQVDDISEPIEYLSPRGEKAYRIVVLQSRTPPHTASLTSDYAKIRKAALEEKRSRVISDWVKERIGSVYIQIDPMYSDCEVLQAWQEP